MNNDNPESALKSFMKAIELDSTMYESYFCKANIYLSKKNYDQAEKDYLKAEKLKPVYPENLNNLAFLYSETGRMNLAIDCYSKAITMKPMEYFFQRRATCYTLLNNYKMAMLDYTKAIEMNPANAEMYFNRGVCFFHTEQREKACIDWKKASSMGYGQANQYLESYCK